MTKLAKKMTLDYYLNNYQTLKISGASISVIEAQMYILEDIIETMKTCGYIVKYKCSETEKTELLEAYGDDVFFINEIRIIGSRVHGTNREDSDIDVLLEYEGKPREDDVYNCFKIEPIDLDGFEIDINPITPCKSGTAMEWLKRNFSL